MNAQEVVGKTSLELNVWADARDRQAMVELVRQNSRCRGLEVQFRKKNGEIVWGEMSASEIEIDGADVHPFRHPGYFSHEGGGEHHPQSGLL